jgi:transposase
MEKDVEKRVLEKVLLPINTAWEVSSVSSDELSEEIFVKLHYKYDYVEDNGNRYPIYDHRKMRKWRHLDLWQYKTYLMAEVPRYKDKNGFFKTVSIPWSDEYERITNLLKKKTIETLQATKSQSKTADLLRISFEQVHRIMHQSVQRGMSLRDKNEHYYYLSIDEKSVHKGHDYVSILSDEGSGIVIDVIDGRSDESVEELCHTSLSARQREVVKTVCSDMWQPYIKGIGRWFSNALLCHDPFHSVGYLNKAVDKCRKREVKKYEELRKTKWIFLKDKANLTDEQYFKFESISKSNYEVSRAWQVKENFRDILYRQTPQAAFSLFYMWKESAKHAGIKEIDEVVGIFERHEKGIINAMKTGANNARAERLNGAIQELKTIGRCYRNTANFRTAILFFHGNLDLFPHK